MKIKIVTTKKKLTKTKVNQMRFPSDAAIKDGEVLGFLIGIVKDCYKVILIQYECDYYIIPANFTKGNISAYRKVGRWSQTKKFKTAKDCDTWWQAYTAIQTKATSQIYI